MLAPALTEVQKVSWSLGADRGGERLNDKDFNGFAFEGDAWQVGYDGEASIRQSHSTCSLINNGVFDFLRNTLSGPGSHYSEPEAWAIMGLDLKSMPNSFPAAPFGQLGPGVTMQWQEQ